MNHYILGLWRQTECIRKFLPVTQNKLLENKKKYNQETQAEITLFFIYLSLQICLH